MAKLRVNQVGKKGMGRYLCPTQKKKREKDSGHPGKEGDKWVSYFTVTPSCHTCSFWSCSASRASFCKKTQKQQSALGMWRAPQLFFACWHVGLCFCLSGLERDRHRKTDRQTDSHGNQNNFTFLNRGTRAMYSSSLPDKILGIFFIKMFIHQSIFLGLSAFVKHLWIFAAFSWMCVFIYMSEFIALLLYILNKHS